MPRDANRSAPTVRQAPPAVLLFYVEFMLGCPPSVHMNMVRCSKANQASVPADFLRSSYWKRLVVLVLLMQATTLRLGFAADLSQGPESMNRLVAALFANTASKFVAPEPASNGSPAWEFAPHLEQAQDYWSLLGQLQTADGREFGVHIAFARAGLQGPATVTPARFTWRPTAVYVAWLGLTDVAGQRYLSTRRLSREALGLSGGSAEPARIWVDNWQLNMTATGPMLQALMPTEFGLIDLHARLPAKPTAVTPALGEPGPVRAYAVTRLPTTGTIQLDGATVAVTGQLWLDRAWGQLPLSMGQMSVDRFQLQLDDGRDIGLVVLHRRNAQAGAVVRGVLVEPRGAAQTLTATDVQVQVLQSTRGSATQVSYPAVWHLEIKGASLALVVTSVPAGREVANDWPYRSSLVHVAGDKIHGSGYVQLSGYTAQP
jgi:predicted secreted hydrolase